MRGSTAQQDSQGRPRSGWPAVLAVGLMVGLGLLGTAATSAATPSASPVAGASAASAASPAAAGSSEGQQIFETQCSSCHNIGGGTLVGPDLQGVGDRRTDDWLVQWMTNPQAVIDSGDTYAKGLSDQFGMVMPTLGLSSDQVSAVVAYLDAPSGGATGAPSPSAAAGSPVPTASPVVQGDPLTGKDLFTGQTSFQNGGPPCMACHTAAGIGSLGGGRLGPDLSTTFRKTGPAGIQAVLTSLPFPTMKAVWSDHPITPGEQADIVAFLQTSPAKRSPSAVGDLIAVVVQIVGLLFLLMALIFIGRLTSVRRAMVKRAVKRA